MFGSGRKRLVAAARGRALAFAGVVAVASWSCGQVDRGVAEASPESHPPAPEAAGFGTIPVEDVLLVTVDTLRADALGFSPNERAETPALDRLAAAGWVYSNAHAHSVMTLPSHANLLTGLNPYQHGVRDNTGFRLPVSMPTAAELFSAAGFATGAFVAAFPLDARFGLDRGFEVYDDDYPRDTGRVAVGANQRAGGEVVERALAWWRLHSGERRFAWVHLYDPHAPYAPPEPFASRFAGDPYAGEVAATDAFLRPLLDLVTDREAPPALVVFTSDHGEALGDHGEKTHGLFAYEATLRVPLVLWAPGVEPARPSRGARHIDLLPTMLRSAGVAVPAGLAGSSLLEPEPLGAVTYFEAMTAHLERGWAPLRGVISAGYKMISLPLPELYDLAADPGETTNRVASDRRRARELAELLPAGSASLAASGAVTAEERAALESLGYLSGRAPSKASYGAADDPKNLVALDRKIHEVVDRFHTGRLREAARLAEEAIRERPDLGPAYYYLAQSLLEEGRAAEALEVMQRARELEAASGVLLRQLSLLLAEAGRYREALEILERYRSSEDPEGLSALGQVLTQAGRHAEARTVLGRAVGLDDDDPRPHEALALASLNVGDWAQARQDADRALALNDALPLSWNYLGTALYNLGERRQALAALRQAVTHDPENFDSLYNLAVVAMEVGDQAVARQALGRFVAEAPPARYQPDIRQARLWLQGLGAS